MATYHDIIEHQYNLSPHQLGLLAYSNPNVFPLRSLLSHELTARDNGTDIGSDNYLRASDYIFIKAKAASSESYTIDLTSPESFEFMNRHAFKPQELKAGDILISKDSNIGECCILDRDYPRGMLASAFYKLPLDKYKYYIFAFMKTVHFKDQLDLMVPRGATIRHAGTKFLDCDIPFPSGANSANIINQIEALVASLINREQHIKTTESQIFALIEKELVSRSHASLYALPTYQEILAASRTDAGYYCEDRQRISSLVRNYTGGFSTLRGFGYTISRGQNLQISCIGKSIESSTKEANFYKVVKPTNLSDYGTVKSYDYLGNKNQLALLKDGDIVFSAEGTIGKCAMFSDVGDEKIITNIHGIILNKTNHDVVESGFVCCFLRYLRKVGFLDYLSVGGQGGSLAMKYWDDVIIPRFPDSLMRQISDLYCGTKDGIIALSDEVKSLRHRLDAIFDLIVSRSDLSLADLT